MAIIVFIILAAIVLLPTAGMFHISLDSQNLILLDKLNMLIAITAATFSTRMLLDKRSITSLGLNLNPQALRDILAGIAITFFQMGLIFIIELGMGWIKFEGFSWEQYPPTFILSQTGLWLLVFLFVGWEEELLSRGYHLQTLESGLNLLWALIISSSIFSIFHIFNPGAGWFSSIGLILAGLFLALPYLLTRQLWLSVGLHIGWNFFQGVVFGFNVSGLNTFRLILHTTIHGMDMWTGGTFGPEAGLVILPALISGSVLIFLYTQPRLRIKNNQS